jgi:hypothetical protein
VQYIAEVARCDFERQETKLYGLELVDNSGNVCPVSLMGIDKIASNPGSSDVSIAYDTFPHVPEYVLDRPHGEVCLLIGQDNVTLLPWGEDGPNLVHNLRVMNTRFGSGYVLGGSHRDIPQAEVQYTEEAKLVCSARFTRLVSVSEEEIRPHMEDGGFINYIGHHGVEKDTSTTTPLRLVAKN